MDWIDILWPVFAGASLMLGLIHASIWYRERSEWQHLIFSVAAISVAAIALTEAVVMKMEVLSLFVATWRWGHVIYATTIISLVGYVHLRFKESRLWLPIAIVATRLLALVLNFTTGDLINFTEITALRESQLLGAKVMVPVGTVNPWMIVPQLSQLLFMIYLVDVVVRVWRSGSADQRMPALIVCGSIFVFMASGNVLAVLTILGMIKFPIVINAAFVLVIAVMSYELGGGVLRSAMLAHDLGRSEAKLRASQVRLQLAAEAGDLGLWEWQISKGSSWLTDSSQALLGAAAGKGISWDELLAKVYPSDQPVLRKAREVALGSGTYACDFRIMREDGEIRWLTSRGRTEGMVNPGMIHGVVQDITERRLADERFRRVVENAPYAILMIDAKGCITFANVQAEQLVGLAVAELIGMPMDEIVVLDWLGAITANDAHELPDMGSDAPEKRAKSEELRIRHKDGHEVWAEIALTPVRMAEGPAAIVTLANISERRKLEKETALQRDEVAHLSRITFLGEMSGSLAHELNQPLTAVLSNAQAALRFLDRPVPDLVEVRESLVHIIDSDKRASEVIRRVRGMMRKDAAKYEQVSVNQIVQESLQLLATDLLNRNVHSMFEPAPGEPQLSADPVQIKQVLLNLIINACDAMHTNVGDRLVYLRTLVHHDGGIEIAISDNGSGIPDENIEEIFTAFMTTKADGSGLGLAICRTIVEAHGGRLWATNNEGAGATFHVLLPAPEADADADGRS